jgi:twitching motility protein PilT
MRDRLTVEIGLTAAETGHLVLASLHTIDAGQTINRIVGMFETEEHEQVRVRLADTLRWVISQRLVPRVGGGRTASWRSWDPISAPRRAFRSARAKGKTFYEIIEASYTFGWRTFDHSTLEAYADGLIARKPPCSSAPSAAPFRAASTTSRNAAASPSPTSTTSG